MNAQEIAAVALLCFGAVGLYCWNIAAMIERGAHKPLPAPPEQVKS
jgi:hypothetical protein